MKKDISKFYNISLIAAISLPLLVMAGCSSVKSEAKYPTGDRSDRRNANDIYGKRDSVFGEKGIDFRIKTKESHVKEVGLFTVSKISLVNAVKIAEISTKGKAFNAEIDEEADHPVYEVKILKDAQILEVLVDGNTGRVLKVSEDE